MRTAGPSHLVCLIPRQLIFLTPITAPGGCFPSSFQESRQSEQG